VRRFNGEIVLKRVNERKADAKLKTPEAFKGQKRKSIQKIKTKFSLEKSINNRKVSV
jgi:hypothetical protein